MEYLDIEKIDSAASLGFIAHHAVKARQRDWQGRLSFGWDKAVGWVSSRSTRVKHRIAEGTSKQWQEFAAAPLPLRMVLGTFALNYFGVLAWDIAGGQPPAWAVVYPGIVLVGCCLCAVYRSCRKAVSFVKAML